jgi:hypothetical protein
MISIGDEYEYKTVSRRVTTNDVGSNSKKPRFRYNWKMKRWDELFKFNSTFSYMMAGGDFIEVPWSLYDTLKEARKL